MVKGIAQLHARFNKIPNTIKLEVMAAMEKEANTLVSEMKLLVPVEHGDLRNSIKWTWGKTPKGALKIGKAFGKNYGKIAITIYASDPKGVFDNARMQEFGTKKMQSSPFFFPVYRANKQIIKGQLSRAVTRGVKKNG